MGKYAIKFRPAVGRVLKKVISQSEMDQRTADVQVVRAQLNHTRQAVREADGQLQFVDVVGPDRSLIAHTGH